MKEPVLGMGCHAEIIIDKISSMLASAAKEDKKGIVIPISQVEYLIHSIKYAYAIGVISGEMDSSIVREALDFTKFFNEKYGE